MSKLELEGILHEVELTESTDYEFRIGDFVLLTFGYCGGLFHFLEEFLGYKVRITVEILEK